MELRPYQIEAGDAIRDNLAKGVKRQMVVLPTGCGKTVIFSKLPDILGDALPMLVLAHREELLVQAKDKIEAANPHLRVAIEQAANYAEGADVVVASVPTLGRADGRRIQRFSRDYFRAVVIDEAHHAAAESYRRVLDYFDCDLRIGFTATPQRSDNTRLDDVFDDIVYYRNIGEMINEGWLSPLVGYRLNTEVDLSKVRITRGDYSDSDLSQAINIDARNEAIVDGYLQFAEGRKCIVFCADVAHTQSVQEAFNTRGIGAAAIVGSTPSEERAKILSNFRHTSMEILTNCMVLTEGFDEPAVSAIIMARPTQSQLLYTQCVGRGTRLFANKKDCIVLDIADVSRGRTPVGLPSLMGLPPEFDLEGKELHEVAAQYSKLASTAPGEIIRVRSLKDIDAAWEKIDLFSMPEPNPVLLAFSSLIWVQSAEESYYLGIGNGQSVHIISDALGRWQVTYQQPNTEPQVLGSTGEMADAFSLADSWVKANRGDAMALLFSNAQWRADPVTDKQAKSLRRFGVPVTSDMTKGHASFLLDKLSAANPRPQWLKNKINSQKRVF